ncbi:MAG: Uridine kinase, partial [uncultured Blastococcus sp.]
GRSGRGRPGPARGRGGRPAARTGATCRRRPGRGVLPAGLPPPGARTHRSGRAVHRLAGHGCPHPRGADPAVARRLRGVSARAVGRRPGPGCSGPTAPRAGAGPRPGARRAAAGHRAALRRRRAPADVTGRPAPAHPAGPGVGAAGLRPLRRRGRSDGPGRRRRARRPPRSAGAAAGRPVQL